MMKRSAGSEGYMPLNNEKLVATESIVRIRNRSKGVKLRMTLVLILRKIVVSTL